MKDLSLPQLLTYVCYWAKYLRLLKIQFPQQEQKKVLLKSSEVYSAKMIYNDAVMMIITC